MVKKTVKKNGFTLIELLMVISIISLISGIILVITSGAQAHTRDALRTQQMAQINIATEQYILANDHAPDLQGTCNVSAGGDLTNCIARSTADPLSDDPTISAQGKAWGRFIQDVSPYLKLILSDPCGNSGCASVAGAGANTGYVYVAPAAMLTVCGNGCTRSTDEINNSYQLYTVLERFTFPQGVASFGSFVETVNSQPIVFGWFTNDDTGEIVTDLHESPLQYHFHWSSTDSTTCQPSGNIPDNIYISDSQYRIPPATFTLNNRTSGSFPLAGVVPGSGSINISCTGSGGSTSFNTPFTVISNPAPIISLTSTLTSIPMGQSTQVRWTTQWARMCQGTYQIGEGSIIGNLPPPGWSSAAVPSGSIIYFPALRGETSNITLILSCAGFDSDRTQTIVLTGTGSP